MTAQNIKEIVGMLDPMFDKLAELSSVGFELAVKQNYVYAIQDCVVAAFALIIGLVLCVLLLKKRKEWDWDGYESWKPWVTLLAIGVCCIFIIGEAMYAIPRFINPEWMAIKDILDMVQSGS